MKQRLVPYSVSEHLIPVSSPVIHYYATIGKWCRRHFVIGSVRLYISETLVNTTSQNLKKAILVTDILEFIDVLIRFCARRHTDQLFKKVRGQSHSRQEAWPSMATHRVPQSSLKVPEFDRCKFKALNILGNEGGPWKSLKMICCFWKNFYWLKVLLNFWPCYCEFC